MDKTVSLDFDISEAEKKLDYLIEKANRLSVTLTGLEKTPTCDLVNELEKREGVEAVSIDPYQHFEIIKNGKRSGVETMGGVARILIVRD